MTYDAEAARRNIQQWLRRMHRPSGYTGPLVVQCDPDLLARCAHLEAEVARLRAVNKEAVHDRNRSIERARDLRRRIARLEGLNRLRNVAQNAQDAPKQADPTQNDAEG